MTPRVSIVTISFNQARFLRATIDSVLAQKSAGVQYIVADPGSTDGSREIIESYGTQIDERLFEPDCGPGDGLNKGFQRAIAPILGYLNSDDLLLPGAVDAVVSAFAERPNVDVISGHAQIIDAEGRVLRESYSDKFRVNPILYRAGGIMQPSTYFRRECFDRTSGFNVANRFDWDAELFVDMYLAGARFDRINRFLSGYRIYPSTVTAERTARLLLEPAARKLFEQKKRRSWRWYDHPRRWGYLAMKYLSEPRWMRERLLRGKVAGRFSRQGG